jgi:hypothetical protein
MEVREYYPCQVLLHGTATFLIWYAAEQDGFAIDGKGRLVTAADLESLLVRAHAMNITFRETRPAQYNFDVILSWCARPAPAGVDCKAFLDVWNFLDDLAATDEEKHESWIRLSRAADNCYDKLFWGNNLPAVTPPGEHFVPTWRLDELATIRDVLRTGVERLEQELAFTTSM